MNQDGADLGTGKNDGKFRRTLYALDATDKLELSLEHLLIKKEQRAEGLILRGSRDAAVDGQVAEKCRNLFLPHFIGVTFAVKEDVASDPIHVGLFGADAVAFHAQLPPNAVQQFRRGSDSGI